MTAHSATQEWRQYRKAPIVEAVIDIRVVRPKSFSIDSLSEIRSLVADTFPVVEEMHSGKAVVQVAPDKATVNIQQENKFDGYRFSSRDNNWIFQSRINAFAFSVVGFYEGWESLRNTAHRFWTIYRSVGDVDAISRVAVRYINRIDIPEPEHKEQQIEQKDYLRTYVEVSNDYPCYDLGAFAMQLQIPQPDIDAMLLLNQVRVAPPKPNMASIILDIDLFKDKTTSPWDSSNDVAVWECLDQLRVRKNEIFEGSITDRTRELFE